MSEQTPTYVPKYSPATTLLMKDLEEAKTEENAPLVKKIMMNAIRDFYSEGKYDD